MENALFHWTLNNTPTIAICMALIWFSVWLTVRIIDYRNRLRVVESDSASQKKSVRILRRNLRRLDAKVMDMDRKIDHKLDNLKNDLERKIESSIASSITPINLKLDKLITHLTASKTIDFKD